MWDLSKTVVAWALPRIGHISGLIGGLVLSVRLSSLGLGKLKCQVPIVGGAGGWLRVLSLFSTTALACETGFDAAGGRERDTLAGLPAAPAIVVYILEDLESLPATGRWRSSVIVLTTGLDPLSHRNTNFTIEGGRALFVWWTVLFFDK